MDEFQCISSIILTIFKRFWSDSATRSGTEPSDLKRLGRFLGTGLLTSEGEYHRRQRQLAQPAFHWNRIQRYADVMVEYTERAIDRWQPPEVRDVSAEMSRLTMAIVGKTLFGAEVDTATMARITGALAVLQRASADILQIVFPFPEWLPSQTRVGHATAEMDAALLPIIAARRAAGTDRGDLLSMLLLAQDEENGAGMSDRQLRDETVTIFLAGHETTANALAWVWYLLAKHPAAATRLHAELDEVLGNRAPTLEDLPRLQYTKMVVKETLRLYPPAWMLSPRQAQADVEIGGYRIPTGSIVIVSPYVIHHNPTYFPQPERFEPERFSAEREQAIPKYAHIPFGAGQHVCIGQSFALMEVQLLLATIARRFRLTLAHRQVVTPEALITLGVKNGLRMGVQAREPRPMRSASPA